MKKAPYDFINYTEFWVGRDYEDRAERIAINKFFKKIDNKDSLLDIGGGFGRLAFLYAPIFKKCLILDPAQKNLDEGRGQLKAFNNVDFILGTSDNLPEKDFDVVLLIRVSHHLPEPFATFQSVNKCLNKNGYFIIDVANKIHFLARIKAYLKGNFAYIKDLKTIDIRSAQAKKEDRIIFVNHHPLRIEKLLNEAGFTIVDKLSVSNFRNPTIKKIVPEKILLFFENLLQKPLASIFFGPSIFLLCKKI